MSPVQVKILPVSDKFLDYAKEVAEKLDNEHIRVEVDTRSEKLGWKIREAQKEKVPYMLVVGEKDMNDKTVSVRSRKQGDEGAVTLCEFMDRIKKEIADKAN